MEHEFADWFDEMRERYRENPRRAPLYFGYSLYLPAWFGFTSRYPIGMNIYERDWDVLILLDACRVDTLRAVQEEYEFLQNIESIWSVGSQSAEWIANTFTNDWRDEIKNTIYLASNGYTESVISKNVYPPRNNTIPVDCSLWDVVDEQAFQSLEKVWKRHHNEKYGVVLPKTMTDYAIDAGRQNRFDKMIVHYLQPHLPYIGEAYSEGREPTELETRGYELLESGHVSRKQVYELYTATLRYVLDEVQVLIQNIDAEKIVLTADHGEAFGEGGVYGHPEGFPHPVVKKVPWVEMSGKDEETREPSLEADRSVDIDVKEHLRDLGYR